MHINATTEADRWEAPTDSSRRSMRATRTWCARWWRRSASLASARDEHGRVGAHARAVPLRPGAPGRGDVGSSGARRVRCGIRSVMSNGCVSCSTPNRRSRPRSRRDGFTALHFAAFFGGAERPALAPRARSGRRCARTRVDDRHAAELGGLRAARGRRSPPAGCGGRPGRSAGERLDAAALRRAQRRPRAASSCCWHAAPIRPRRTTTA